MKILKVSQFASLLKVSVFKEIHKKSLKKLKKDFRKIYPSFLDSGCNGCAENLCEDTLPDFSDPTILTANNAICKIRKTYLQSS